MEHPRDKLVAVQRVSRVLCRENIKKALPKSKIRQSPGSSMTQSTHLLSELGTRMQTSQGGIEAEFLKMSRHLSHDFYSRCWSVKGARKQSEL